MIRGTDALADPIMNRNLIILSHNLKIEISLKYLKIVLLQYDFNSLNTHEK